MGTGFERIGEGPAARGEEMGPTTRMPSPRYSASLQSLPLTGHYSLGYGTYHYLYVEQVVKDLSFFLTYAYFRGIVRNTRVVSTE